MTVPTPTRRAVAEAATQVRRERVEWLEAGRVPLRMVTVLAGVGGLGKSQLTCLWAARNAGVTLIATAEDSPSTTVRPRLEAVKADLGRVYFVSIQSDDGIEDGLTIPDDMPELERLVTELEARLVIVDPLVAHLPTHIDSHKDQSVRRALAPLYRLAEAQGCAVVALLHLNKTQGLAPMMRLSGSGAFGNAARSVLLLDRDPGDPDGDEGNQRVLAHIKCNVAPLAPSLLYRVAPILLPDTDTDPEVETSRLELLGESQVNGRALLSSASDDERTAQADAEEFLRVELGYGTKQQGTRYPAEDMLKGAERIGITKTTLHRARHAIGVETEKAGFGRGWEWWLPVGATKIPADPDEPAFPHERSSTQDTEPSRQNGADGPSSNGDGGGRHIPVFGDDDYPDWVDQKFHDGHLTEREWIEQRKVHAFVMKASAR
jgi:hypothetical protein